MICPQSKMTCHCKTANPMCAFWGMLETPLQPPTVTVHKCPVCEGRGQLGEDSGYKACHGCDGKGWVRA